MVDNNQPTRLRIQLDPAIPEEKKLIDWLTQFRDPEEQVKKILLGKEMPPISSLRDEVERIVKEVLGTQALALAAQVPAPAGGVRLEEEARTVPGEGLLVEIEDEPPSEEDIKESLLRAFE